MGKKVKLDFTGVESFQKASEGQHVAKIVSAEEVVASTGSDMLKIAFEVTTGTDKGCRVYENYVLAENSLWKLKGLLNALGVKADGKVVIDLDKLIGKTCIIEVVHEEYNGVMRAKIADYKNLATAEDNDEDDEEENETPKKEDKKPSKKSAPKKVEDDEDDDFEDEDEEEDEEEEKPAKKSKKPEKKPAKKPAKKVEEDDDDDDEFEDDDDDDWDEE